LTECDPLPLKGIPAYIAQKNPLKRLGKGKSNIELGRKRQLWGQPVPTLFDQA